MELLGSSRNLELLRRRHGCYGGWLCGARVFTLRPAMALGDLDGNGQIDVITALERESIATFINRRQRTE